MSNRSLLQLFAGAVSSSVLFHRGRQLWEANSRKWDLPLSKTQKLLCGAYIILNDYSKGVFPPQFEDQADAYRNEVEYSSSLPGFSLEQVQATHTRKPFWGSKAAAKYLSEFNRLYVVIEQLDIRPGARLLELGCGSGWMAEFLALAGYSVLGTSISHHEIAVAERKAAALQIKDHQAKLSLQFATCPMESVDSLPDSLEGFDAVYVYEALHHAYDWRKTFRAADRVLKPGGWMILANEPNRLHTCISYRVAKLSKTHEIGFSRRDLVAEFRLLGFSPVRILRPTFDNRVTPHWIAARKRPR